MPGLYRDPDDRQHPYLMPFLLSAGDRCAKYRQHYRPWQNVAVIPWQMAIVARVLRRAAELALRPAIQQRAA